MIILLVILALPTAGYFLLVSKNVQTHIVAKFLNDLSEKVNAEISVKSVKVRFFNNLTVEDLLVKDQNMDTLLFVPKLHLDVDSFSLKKRRAIIDKVKIYSPDIRLSQDSLGQFNFGFIIDSLRGKQSLKSAWNIDVAKVLMGNGDIRLDMTANPNVPYDFPLRFRKTALTTKIHHLGADSLNLEVSLLKFIEDKGLQLKSLSSNAYFSHGDFILSELKIKTEESQLITERLFLRADSGFAKDQIGKAEFKMAISALKISPEEVKLYQDVLSGISDNISFKGVVQGTVDNFKGDNLELSLGNTADLLFDIQMDGASHFDDAFFHTNFRKLYINLQKVPVLYQKLVGKTFPLKNELSKLGQVYYQGVLTGFYGDLVTYGAFSTDLGYVSTDLSLRKERQTNKLELSGKMSTKDFFLGAFLNYKDLVGNVTMNIEIEGDKPENEPFSMYINGAADSLEFNNYIYQNVLLRGLFGTKNFNGGISVQDPNLNLMFTGRIDFSSDLPRYDFVADVYHAYLSNLNFYKKFKNDKLQMRVKTKLMGNSIDNLFGFVGFSEIKYHNMNGPIELENASLSFTPGETDSEIAIHSDILDVTLNGKYNIGQIKSSLAAIAEPYLPSISHQIGQVDQQLNNFDYNIVIRDFSEIARVFELPVSVNTDASIKGNINDGAKNFSMNMDIPDVTFEGFNLKRLSLNVSNQNSRPLTATFHADQIFLGKKKKIENVDARLVAAGDSILSTSSWLNNQQERYSGDINMAVIFSDKIKDNLLSDIYIRPSSIVIRDSAWNIDNAIINVDTSGVLIHNFKFGEGARFVEANGKLSRIKSDKLDVNLQHVDMSYLFNFINVKRLDLTGIVHGNALIYSGLRRPIILSDIEVNDFYINNTYADHLFLKSEWDNENGLMNIHLRNTKGQLEQIKMDGTFNPSNKGVDFDFYFNKCRLEYVQPYLESVVQGMKGTASGPIHVFGTGLDLDLVGDIVTRNGTVNIDYLKTSYYIKDTIHFEKDNIRFSDFKIADRDNHKGSLTGNVRHNTFKNLNYNMVVDFDNCLVMDTKERDNNLFYGSIYGTGIANISGKGGKVLMDVSGRSEPNSIFKMPLSSGEVAGESDFVRFRTENEVQADLTTDVALVRDGTSGLTLNLELEATPDAYMELIFDSRLGDVIKGRGSGTLVFKYDTYEEFKMYGEYTVEEGEYLFTLQNIINKKFDIEPGGTITWGGDPYEAIIDLDAYYGAKASLNDLMPAFDALSENKTRRIPVNCHMMLTENLMNPAIKFDIELPTAPQETQQRARNIINTDDEMNKQIFSLLALNSFVTPDYLQAANPVKSQTAAIVTTSEFLSNQLSHWLSQISNDFDVGVNYRPSDLLTSREIEVMLSTQIFDDKVSINGNFGYREAQAIENSSSFVGDFDMDVKLNSTGNLRLKAYTHSNDQIFYDSKTTQAVGFIFKEEFNNWEELLEMYAQRKINRLRKREEKSRQKKLEKMNDSERKLEEEGEAL